MKRRTACWVLSMTSRTSRASLMPFLPGSAAFHTFLDGRFHAERPSACFSSRRSPFSSAKATSHAPYRYRRGVGCQVTSKNIRHSIISPASVVEMSPRARAAGRRGRSPARFASRHFRDAIEVLPKQAQARGRSVVCGRCGLDGQADVTLGRCHGVSVSVGDEFHGDEFAAAPRGR